MKSKFKDKGISILIIIFCLFYIFLQNKLGAGLGTNKVISDDVYAEIASLGSFDVKNSKVILFVTSWCGQCKSLIRELNKNNIDFDVYDIEIDIAGQNLYERVMGRHSGPVPVTLVGKKVFVGNQSKKIVDLVNTGKSST